MELYSSYTEICMSLELLCCILTLLCSALLCFAFLLRCALCKGPHVRRLTERTIRFCRQQRQMQMQMVQMQPKSSPSAVCAVASAQAQAMCGLVCALVEQVQMHSMPQMSWGSWVSRVMDGGVHSMSRVSRVMDGGVA